MGAVIDDAYMAHGMWMIVRDKWCIDDPVLAIDKFPKYRYEIYLTFNDESYVAHVKNVLDITCARAVANLLTKSQNGERTKLHFVIGKLLRPMFLLYSYAITKTVCILILHGSVNVIICICKIRYFSCEC